MAVLHIPPTKSSLLATRRQLAVAEEGYDLLEQKRQILVFELMKRVRRARELERRLDAELPAAHAALREATLDTGSRAIDQAAAGVPLGHEIQLGRQHLMALKLPQAAATVVPHGLPFGVSGTSGQADLAVSRFSALLPLLAELASLQTAIQRLAAELRRTQRRCNALGKIFIPNTRQTLATIVSILEEREREAFVTTRMIRDRLAPLGGASRS